MTTTIFAAIYGVHGRELWRTDGTAGGTSTMTVAAPGIVLARNSDVSRNDPVIVDAQSPPRDWSGKSRLATSLKK